MRIGALVLGLIGAVCGFVGGAAVAVVGGAAVLNFGEFGITFGSEESSVAVWRGMLAVFASIVAAGGAFHGAEPPKGFGSRVYFDRRRRCVSHHRGIRRGGRIPGQRRAVCHLRQQAQELRPAHRHRRSRPAATASGQGRKSKTPSSLIRIRRRWWGLRRNAAG